MPDAETVVRPRIAALVAADFGLAWGHHPDGACQWLWCREIAPSEEDAFEADAFLLTKAGAGVMGGDVVKRARTEAARTRIEEEWQGPPSPAAQATGASLRHRPIAVPGNPRRHEVTGAPHQQAEPS